MNKLLIAIIILTGIISGCDHKGSGTYVGPESDPVIGDFGFVPEGDFRMGSLYNSDESPIHTVWVDNYYINIFEVTNAEYAYFLSDSGTSSSHLDENMDITRTGATYEATAGLEDYPIRWVSWYDAQAYAEWIGGRLPTEAEWEKAARGPSNERIFPWGNVIQAGLANYYNAQGGLWEVGTATGRSYYGCYDMAGNVWEWTADWYDEQYYSSSPYRNPAGAAVGTVKTIRGGGFLNESEMQMRCSDRFYTGPDNRFEDLGFRCVIDSVRSN